MKRVKIFRYDEFDIATRKYPIVEDGYGTFHEFGIDFKQLDNGHVGQYSTAIVERDDGTVVNLSLFFIKFLGET